MSRFGDLGVRMLVLLYPRAWRDRYADEFALLLADDLAARHTGPRWWCDVIVHGLWTRARATTPRAAAAIFVLPALAIWAQLAVGWQWAPPADRTVRVGIEMMTAGLAGVLVTGAVALCVDARRHARTRSARGHARSAQTAVALASAAALVAGAIWIGAHWPGTGGHAWAQRSLLPAAIARPTWALTASISAYWVHPRAMLALGGPLLAWMVASPALLVTLALSLRALARARVSPRSPRELGTILGVSGVRCRALAPGMTCFLAGAVLWLGHRSAAPAHLYGTGVIDVILVAAAALGCARTVARCPA